MHGFSKKALGLLAVLVAAASASDVVDLKKDTFDAFVTENDLVLAEFFAPWCGHCKALAPEYEEAATTLKEKNIALAKVDCTEEAELCQSFGVEGYPTLKVFRGLNNHQPYGGQRKAPAIISYMTKQGLPSVSILAKDTLEDFKTADKVVLVAYFDAKDTKSNETFTTIANSLRDTYLFGATSDAALAKAEGVTAPALVLYKQFDEGKDVFDGTFDAESIDKFIKTASVPLIGEVGPETYANYMASGLPLAYIFAETPEERESFAKDFKSIAQQHKGKINLATIDAKAFGQHGQNLNLEVGQWPAFAIQETVKNQKFPFDQSKKLTAKDIGAFVEDFLAGKVEPSIKSEPIPEKNDDPVTVIVAHNYKDVVLDNDKDVLVEFYAPWCGHCKALAPKYEELGRLFSPFSSQVTIAKVDATANDVPDEISGFPTIKLFPGNSKSSPVDYSGSRTAEDLAAFIRDNGAHKIDVYADGANGSVDVDMEDVAGYVTSAVAGATEDMQHQAPAATASAKSAAKAATDAAGSAASSASDAAGSAASSATDKAASAASSVSGAASSATDAAGSAASSVADKAASAASSASGAASSATDAAASSVSSATNAAGSAASSVADKAGSVAKSATDAAGSVAGSVTEQAGSAASVVGEQVESATEHAGAAVTEVIGNVVGGAAKIIEAVVGGGDDVDDHDEL